MNGTNTISPRSDRFFDLVGDLQNDVKNLIRKEVDLAKVEIGEKCSALARHAAFAAAGGVLALFALFLLLLGFGAIFARLLQRADLSPGAAYFLSFTGLALILGGIGYALIHKALKAFSRISLAPDKAIAGMKGGEPVPIEIRRAINHMENGERKPKQTSGQLQSEVIATRMRMDEEMSELRQRLTPGYLLRSCLSGIAHHPAGILLMGASTGLGGYLLWRNHHLVNAKNVQALRKWWQLKSPKVHRN